MIPQETIEQIRQATDIVQIIGDYLRLKKRGRNFQGLCPFHTEKTPSFNVSPEKQIFHCFGCGKGGNVFTFLMEHEKMSFIEAVKFLARKANITIKEEQQSDYRRELLDRLNYANDVALEYFQKTLFSIKYKDILDNYLRGRRRIGDDAIKYFQLGLAGEDWQGLVNFAARKGLTGEDLDKAGLASFSEKGNKYIDRFRQRLMIPVFNLSQRPIAFGGRTLKKGESAKYVNSPETPLYVKGNVLYGLNFAKDAIRDSGSVYIVEGYFDLISLWQIGVRNVVASSGTAFTPQQARLLARFAENVYLFFDADSAGLSAALNSIEMLYDVGFEIKIMIPPTGEDPDSVARMLGRDGIEDLQAEALDIVAFFIRFNKLDMTTDDGKAGLSLSLRKLLSRIGDPNIRERIALEATHRIGPNYPLTGVFSAPRTIRTGDVVAPKRKHRSAVEAGFLSLLFNNPGSIDAIFEKISPDDFDSKEFSRLYAAIINQYRNNGVVDARKLIDNIQDSAFVSLITEVASAQWEDDQVEPETRRFVELIVKEKLKRIRDRLLKELAGAEAAKDQTKANQILQELKSYGLDAK